MRLFRLGGSLLLVCAASALSACGDRAAGEASVYLPKGDPTSGEAHFVALGCVNCHGVAGSDLPEPAEGGPVRVLLGSGLGGKTYGDLVTSIVNPSHKLSARYRPNEVSASGQSLMSSYNDVMTITQLIDIVAFLETYYTKAVRPGYTYPVYRYESEDEQ